MLEIAQVGAMPSRGARAAPDATPHLPTLLMIPLVVISLMLVIVGAVVFADAADKRAGAVFAFVGLLFGVAAYAVGAEPAI